MAYTLKLTNGNILLTLPDQQSDSASTSLTLIGKNVNAYGTDLNDNFIKLMENFANSSGPNAPLNGQLWFDSINNQIKVHIKTTVDSGYWKVVGAPLVSSSQPTTIAPGDFWYDTTTKQMKFRVDSTSTIVVGPQYDSSVGKSGWINETWQTSLNTTATVLSLYSNNRLVSVISDQTFTVGASDPNYNIFAGHVVNQGVNAVYTATMQTRFYGTATSAQSLIDQYGNTVAVSQIITDSTDTTFTHSVNIAVSTATLTLGSDGDFQFYNNATNTTATMFIGGQNENLEIKVNSLTQSGKGPAICIDGTNNIVGMFTTTPITSVQVSQTLGDGPVPVDVDINGNVLIQGNLIVFGTGTNVKTQDLEVVDKNIVLAWTTNATGADSTSDGGGLILRGDRDKYFLWKDEAALPIGSKGYWDVSDSMNLSFADSQFRINGVLALTRDTVYSNYAPNLVSVGNLTSATIANLRIYNTGSIQTFIGSVYPGGVGQIVIGDSTTERVSLNNKKIFDLGYPSANQVTTATYRAMATNVGWVQDQIDIIRNPKFGLTIDVTGKGNSPTDPLLDIFVLEMLTYMFDPNDPDYPYRAPVDARARVLCTRFRTALQNNVPSDFIDLGVPVAVDKGGVQDAALVVGYSTVIRAQTDIPAANLGVDRCIKQYIVTGVYPNATWVAYLPGNAPNNVVWTSGTWL